MLIKYIIILYLITQDYNYSLSIRKDIEFAKQFLKYHGISDENVCKKGHIEESCSNYHEEVCSARVSGKKTEFKQFDNPCYMEFDNVCNYQDNIWAIKNPGPCVMDTEMRRFAKEIEKMAESDPETITNDDTTSTNDEVTETTYETEPVAESTDETEPTHETETTYETGTETETYETTTDESNVATTIAVISDTNLRMGEQIGKIYYDDGSEKLSLRESSSSNSTRFPPMRGKLTFNKEPCEKKVNRCPVLYYPVCLYFAREQPNNVTYYYFINLCEAKQWTCYHPEHQIHGSSSMRAGYCAHVTYLNFARNTHAMSSFSHYGWLHGSQPLSRILKPHERAT
ncbi:uncharacterized protein LOC125239270 [Leguminivora glycinivorella]|uniref:uncharacterized protein LOC125239270 n=1 Tax=Leguminivora glycinivorella TaxID=1035111 RepID=UPI0020103DBD|nr:uncharacterized protein LOC125239270 [Leguminivora glycinivorella]